MGESVNYCVCLFSFDAQSLNFTWGFILLNTFENDDAKIFQR